MAESLSESTTLGRIPEIVGLLGLKSPPKLPILELVKDRTLSFYLDLGGEPFGILNLFLEFFYNHLLNLCCLNLL